MGGRQYRYPKTHNAYNDVIYSVSPSVYCQEKRILHFHADKQNKGSSLVIIVYIYIYMGIGTTHLVFTRFRKIPVSFLVIIFEIITTLLKIYYDIIFYIK